MEPKNTASAPASNTRLASSCERMPPPPQIGVPIPSARTDPSHAIVKGRRPAPEYPPANPGKRFCIGDSFGSLVPYRPTQSIGGTYFAQVGCFPNGMVLQ